MKTLRWWNLYGAIGLMGASLLIPAAQAARTAAPGTVNYVEGQVVLNGSPLSTAQDGSVGMQQDQLLSVQRGKAEVLLSPGVILRVGSNSQIRMVSPELVDLKIEVVRGEAMVEVDYKPKEARLDILERGADAALLKEGLYKFDADEGKVQVIDGKAQVTDNGQSKDFGKGKEVVLTGSALKPVSFDRKAEDELYRWSQVRAGYLAQANEASARTVYVSGGWGGGWGPGWFWNPWYSTFAWMPGNGYFMSPFGYPFYSPGYVMYSPRFASGYIRGGRVITGVSRTGAVRSPGTSSFRPSSSFRSMGSAPHLAAGGGHMGGMRR